MPSILIAAIILLIITTGLIIGFVLIRRSPGDSEELKNKLIAIESDLSKIDPLLRSEFSINRDETRKSFKENRTEQSCSLKSFEDKLREIRDTVEKKISELQIENSKKLDEMRATVDEKLQKTLENRLTESFKQVSERLEQVHRGLGEMQTLAKGVGDLKKVLSNVKTKGVLGEIQLGSILESFLAPAQYEKNVSTKDSREMVEYAIKLPGKDETGQSVYLPIDSKFPLQTYDDLLTAYESGNADEIKSGIKSLENEIKKCAKDIKDKYINPPCTTDFGILFLPVEGLYAEVVRQYNLIETLQRDYKISITGPTTMAAYLNALQMGFRTLAIQKRTSEVWKILGAIKTEFEKFGDVLKKDQEKITRASEDIDTLVGTRTRKIQSKLRAVQELPEEESKILFQSDNPEETTEDDNETE